MQPYTIIIPIYNEILTIENLLCELRYFYDSGHEIIIIDDGSTDGTSLMINNCKFPLTLIKLEKNMGKGNAIILGIKKARYEKIIIYDGDRELITSEIKKLMVLNKSKNIMFAMGYRFGGFNPLKSSFEWGNFMFTLFFNLLYKSNHRDILCCAKAFYKNNLITYHLSSNRFEIDAELTALLTLLNNRLRVPQIPLFYKRRNIIEGKKLRTSDGWKILIKIILSSRYI